MQPVIQHGRGPQGTNAHGHLVPAKSLRNSQIKAEEKRGNALFCSLKCPVPYVCVCKDSALLGDSDPAGAPEEALRGTV